MECASLVILAIVVYGYVMLAWILVKVTKNKV